jgi:hypothetical protein
MTRTFLHSFEPATASPITGTTVDLEVSDIEDAGIREMLQTPGVAYGAWSILDALLAPTGRRSSSRSRSDRRVKSRSPGQACLDASSLALILSAMSISRSSPISAAERSIAIVAGSRACRVAIGPIGSHAPPTCPL